MDPITLSTRQHGSVLTDPFQGWDSSREGKREPGSECPGPPAAWNPGKQTHVLLTASRARGVLRRCGDGVARSEEHATQGPGGIQGTRVTLVTSQVPFRIAPMRCYESFTGRSPQHPQCSGASPSPWPAPCVRSRGQRERACAEIRELLQRAG